MSRAFAVLLVWTLSVQAVGKVKPRFSDIPDGWLSDTTYTNDGIGLKVHVPDGWTAKVDADIPDGLDYHPPKDPSRQCVKVLMSISARGDSAHPEYKSVGSYFVLDPGCFPGAKFPESMDPGKIRDLAGRIIHAFSHSPYIAPNGADVGAFQQEKLLFLMLTGQSSAGSAEGAVHENMMLSLTESNGYWIAWGARADDERLERLKTTSNGLQFWIGPKGKMPQR